MNKQYLLRKRNDAMREIKYTNKAGSHRDCIRINVNNSLEHEIAKLRICYGKYYRLNKKLSTLNDEEKTIYLEKRGILEIKKELTVDDLKKDLGVIK